MKRLVLRRGVIRRYPYHPVLQHSASLRKCFFSGDNVSKSSVEDSASTEDFRNKLLRAPFQRVGTPGPLFPWRHSEQVLPRLIPGSQEFKEKGCLLGGNVVSSNPMFDTYVTAFLFLEVPLYKMMFFKHWQADMAESMSWAFSQAMSAILSHVYQGTWSVVYS